MDLLFVCSEAPTTAHPRPNGLIAALARRGHSVTLLFADEAGTAFDDLAEHCRQLLPVRRRQLVDAVRAEAQPGRFELVQLDVPTAALLPERLALPSVLDAVVCASLRRERSLRAQGPLARAAQSAWLPHLRRDEAALLARHSRVIVAAEADAVALRALAGHAGDGQGQIHVVPSPINLARFGPPMRLRDPATLLLDLRDLARHEAAAALASVATTMATIWAQRAEARLTVLGALPFGAAGRLAGNPRVVFTGPVHDPRGHLASATMILAPVEPSATAPHAALQALATATPLIVRAVLARDLCAVASEELLVADTPDEQAQAAMALLDDAPFRGRLGRGGRRMAERQHSWERAVDALEHVYAAATGSALAEWRLELGMDRPQLAE